MPIRVMLFDLWGTLIVDDPEVAEQRRLHRVQTAKEALTARGYAYSAEQIERSFNGAAEEHSRIHDQGLDISARGRTVLYVQHLDDSLGDRLDDDAWAALDDAILTPALAFPPTLMGGAFEALSEVRAIGLATGLVSNAGVSPGYVLREILRRRGVGPLLDAAVFSDEVEVAKPAAAIFEQALEEFGATPEQAAFVGDQPVLDVLGPRNAGIWSVQFGALEADGIEPHARIATLAELPAALSSLGLIAQD